MNINTFNSLYSVIKTVSERAHVQSAGHYDLNLMWKLLEQGQLPPKDKVSIYSFLEVYTDPLSGVSEENRLYRARGNVVQNVMVPKYDNSFHYGILLCSNLQDGWRKQRENSISFYDPMIFPDTEQPEQSFLQWNVRVVYDVFEIA